MQQLTNIQEIQSAVERYGEIVISKNKKNNVVVMSMKEYKEKILKKEIGMHLLKSEEDIRNGRTRKATDVFRELEEKYGF